MTLVHGGNVYEVAARLGCAVESVLDYSASINPLGPPEGLLAELTKLFHRTQHYPDIHNRSLLDALVNLHGVDRSKIVVGNGSTELIYWLPRVMGIKRAVVALPTFSEYQKAFELAGISLHKLVASVETGFQPTAEQLEHAVSASSAEAVLVTHPGSPSGLLLPEDVREWLTDGARSGRFQLLVDEVFMDFCEEASFKTALDGCDHLVLIRSMTKFYGVPGLRLGYVMTSEALSERLRHFLPPWSVNTLAQVTGSYCLRQEDYRERTLTVVEEERDFLLKEIGGIDGLTPLPGRANYLLVRLDERLPEASVLVRDLVESHCILVRDCSSFEGLGARYFRVAVRLRPENERLVGALSQWCSAHSEP